MRVRKAFEFSEVVSSHAQEAGINGGAKVCKSAVVSIAQALLFGELPEPVIQVEVGAIGGQEQ